jgi:tetratricopeptide (TPR) repeat protein
MNQDATAKSDLPDNELTGLMRRADEERLAGRLDAAAALCKQVLGRQAGHPGALHMLAEIAYRGKDLPRAEMMIRRALAGQPNEPVFHFFLGNVLRDLERAADAERSLRTAVRLRPKFPQALNNLGNVLRTLEKHHEAAACYRRAIELKPDYALAHYNLGNVLRDLEHTQQAIASYRSALQLRPDYFDALNNLGNALKDADQFEAAKACYEQALKIRPQSPEVLNNLANVFRDLNRLDEAEARYTEAIAAQSDFADAHFGRSIINLMRGDYLRGWSEYEWRWKAKDFPALRWTFSEPQWQGEAFSGKTLLLHYEQGYGDNLQLMRYVPLVCERGGRVILELQRPLMRLARTLSGSGEIIPAGGPRPPFDLCCSLMSLPRIFGTTIDTIPGPVPYLRADPALVARWRERLSGGEGLKIGVVWAGNPRQATEKKRGIGLNAYVPLFSIPGTRWFSLQVGDRAVDLNLLPAGTVSDLSHELTDFAETAAVMANLDLVITTDTSVAHLAGAVGQRAWVMLRWLPDWRWECEREDSRWYPSLRLFRQAQRDDWSAPVAAVREELLKLTATAAR